MADVILDIASCFYYKSLVNGDDVVKAKIEDYVKLIGLRVCNIVTNQNIQQNVMSKLSERVLILENETVEPYTLPNLIPYNATEAIPLDSFSRLLETLFYALQSATGSPTQIYEGVAITPNSINSAKALGTTGGFLSSLPGWKSDTVNLASSIGNMWLTLIDLRSAIRNIQLSCCNTTCEAVGVTLQTTLNVKTLKLFFTGNIPEQLVNCVSSGSTFKIRDNSGNFVNYNIDVKANINTTAGLTIDLSGTPLNFADDFIINGILRLCDPENGSQCERYIEETVNNLGSCPALNLTSSFTSISFSFTHLSGALTYSVQLYSDTGVQLQSFNRTVENSTVIVSGIFNDLTVQTNYKIRVQMITETTTKTCAFTIISTSDNVCPAPISATATIELE